MSQNDWLGHADTRPFDGPSAPIADHGPWVGGGLGLAPYHSYAYAYTADGRKVPMTQPYAQYHPTDPYAHMAQQRGWNPMVSQYGNTGSASASAPGGGSQSSGNAGVNSGGANVTSAPPVVTFAPASPMHLAQGDQLVGELRKIRILLTILVIIFVASFIAAVAIGTDLASTFSNLLSNFPNPNGSGL